MANYPWLSNNIITKHFPSYLQKSAKSVFSKIVHQIFPKCIFPFFSGLNPLNS